MCSGPSPIIKCKNARPPDTLLAAKRYDCITGVDKESVRAVPPFRNENPPRPQPASPYVVSAGGACCWPFCCAPPCCRSPGCCPPFCCSSACRQANGGAAWSRERRAWHARRREKANGRCAQRTNAPRQYLPAARLHTGGGAEPHRATPFPPFRTEARACSSVGQSVGFRYRRSGVRLLHAYPDERRRARGLSAFCILAASPLKSFINGPSLMDPKSPSS